MIRCNSGVRVVNITTHRAINRSDTALYQSPTQPKCNDNVRRLTVTRSCPRRLLDKTILGSTSVYQWEGASLRQLFELKPRLPRSHALPVFVFARELRELRPPPPLRTALRVSCNLHHCCTAVKRLLGTGLVAIFHPEPTLRPFLAPLFTEIVLYRTGSPECLYTSVSTTPPHQYMCGPSRKGCAFNGHMTKASNKRARTYLPTCM